MTAFRLVCQRYPAEPIGAQESTQKTQYIRTGHFGSPCITAPFHPESQTKGKSLPTRHRSSQRGGGASHSQYASQDAKGAHRLTDYTSCALSGTLVGEQIPARSTTGSLETDWVPYRPTAGWATRGQGLLDLARA